MITYEDSLNNSMASDRISDNDEQSSITQKVKFSDEMGDVGDGVHPKNVNTPQPLRGLEQVLTILDWDDEETVTALCGIKNFHWLKTITQSILENKEGWSLGMTNEIMYLKCWMVNYLKTLDPSKALINYFVNLCGRSIRTKKWQQRHNGDSKLKLKFKFNQWLHLPTTLMTPSMSHIV